MSGYLTRWRNLPDTPAGRILKAISAAGDRLHHTEGWDDSYYGSPTCMEMIESVVAAEAAALCADSRRLDALLDPDGPFKVSAPDKTRVAGHHGREPIFHEKIIRTRDEIDEVLGEEPDDE